MNRNFARSLPALAVLVVSLLVAGCANSVAPLPAPPRVSVPPTSSSLPDYSGISIAPVKGATTTSVIGIRGGAAVITGIARLNGAPAAGATVHLDRFVDDKSSGLDVVTGADGRYRADGLLGGRYRVRAFRSPDATTNSPQVFFVGLTETKNLDLTLNPYTGNPGLGVAVAPDPPLLGELANFAASITTQQVDSSGVARTVGVAGVQLRLDSAGGRALTSGNIAVTDGSGRATWQFRCVALDSQGLTLTFPDGRTQDVNVATCRVPPPTTTTTTTLPGAGDAVGTTTTAAG